MSQFIEDDGKGICGLSNLGNTCFLNSSIQCLSHIPTLTEYIMNREDEYLPLLNDRFREIPDIQLSQESKYSVDIIRNQLVLTKEYVKLIKAMWSNKLNAIIAPKSFHRILQKVDDRFQGYDQHDAQESLALILDYLHDGLKYDAKLSCNGTAENDVDKLVVESNKYFNKELKEQYSIIIENFFGQFINKIVSLENSKNKTVSKTFEMFNMLNIPIHGKTLDESLSVYFGKEILETKYFEEKTKKHINVYRQIKLMRVPKYLILVLKRFTNSLTKNNNIVTFPIDSLDLSGHAEGYDKYESELKLVSIGCHRGSINGGHYFSICRHVNGKWYVFDDDTSIEFNIDIERNKNILFTCGYILIYQNLKNI